MPMINVQVGAVRDGALTQAIARALTALASRELRKDPGITVVAVHYVPPEEWFVAGTSLAEHGVAGFYVETGVTEGTNSKGEKGRFVETAFDAMQTLLGAVHPTSYVLADEVRADGYGFSGMTQERRYIESLALDVTAVIA